MIGYNGILTLIYPLFVRRFLTIYSFYTGLMLMHSKHMPNDVLKLLISVGLCHF